MASNLALAPANAGDSAKDAAQSLGRAARNLREFHQRTKLTVDQLAQRSGLPKFAVQAAMDSPDDYLPLDVVEPMIPMLTRHGTSLAEILMLVVISERVRLLRNRYGIRIRYIAKMLGFESVSSYQHYESAKRFGDEELPKKVLLPLIRELKKAGATNEELLTIVPLESFNSLAEVIEDLIGSNDTSIELVRRVLHQGQYEVEPIAEVGKLVPIVSGGSIKEVSIDMQAVTGLKRTEEVQATWEEAGFVTGWKRVADPKPFGFLMTVVTDDHSKHFTVGEILEIDRADRDLVDTKHYLVLKGDGWHLGRYDRIRHRLVSEQARRTRLQVLPITDQCYVVGRVVRAIAERSY